MATTAKEFATPEAAAMLAIQDESSPHDKRLEHYYNEEQTEVIWCTTDEREEFEEYAEVALTADVIEDWRDYDAFVRYLSENHALGEM
jgi:hypothetical protein